MKIRYGRCGARFFRLRFLMAALCCCLSGALWGQEAAGVDAQRLQELAQQRTWLRLLHIDPQTGRSEILNDEFYLAPDGRNDALQELKATLVALAQPQQEADESHARCRFPARALWLEKQIGAFPAAVNCPRLQAWMNEAELKSISVMLVSGYFGNPASSFGHSLIRMNTQGAKNTRGLLDISVNFGAVVPDGEPTVAYVLRGLFGGYVAGFSDRYYYTHDQVYTRSEYRDVWEYELALDVWQQRFLVYHLRELLGMKFQYFFLSKNCSYRQAELLELVLDTDFVGDVSVWYAPIELFQRLQVLDQAQDGRLIAGLRYWPSSQRSLHSRFASLPVDVQRWLNAQILVDEPALDEVDGFAPEQQVEALDFLLEYMDYRLLALNDDDPERLQWEARKRRVLKRRLGLPAAIRVWSDPTPQRLTPAARALSSRVHAELGRASGGEAVTGLGYTAFNHDLLGRADRASPELVLLDLRLARYGDASWRLRELDLVRLSRLSPALSDLRGEDQASWQLRLGAQRQRQRCADCLEWFVEGGWGRSWYWQQAWTFSALALGYWGSEALEPAAGGRVRASWHGESLRVQFSSALLWDFAEQTRRHDTALTLSRRLAPQLDGQFVYERKAREAWMLRLQASF